MTYLLDTNVLSELRKPADRLDPGLRRWAETQTPDRLFITTITVFELELGVARIERRDASQGAVLRRWLDDQVLTAFERRILAVDLPVAIHAARLHVPDPRPDRDTFIAATAAVYGFTVVTRNVADFTATGVPILCPWSD